MRNKILIYSGSLAAVLLIGAYLFLYRPLSNKLRTRSAECSSEERQLAGMRRTIRETGKSAEDRVLLPEKDASLAIDELTRHGKAMGINFVSIAPRDIMKPANVPYRILPVEIQTESTGRQFAQFLGLLDSLKKSVITVEKFDIVRDKEDPARLRATVVIDMYFSVMDQA